MRAWAGDSFARILVGDTVYRFESGDVMPEDRVPVTPNALPVSPDEIVAWSPAGRRLDLALALADRRVLDVVALDESRVAAVIADGKGAPRLVVGPPSGPFEVDLDLSRAGTKVKWPRGTIWDSAPPWPKGAAFQGEALRAVRVHASPYGVGVAAASSGHVAVLRPGARELAFVVRVPGQHEARLDAVPTREGALVTLVLEGRHGVVLHVAESGALLGRWPKTFAWGCFPAVRIDDERALAFDQEKGVLALLSLPSLKELGRIVIGGWIADAATPIGGDRVVLADATNVYEVRFESGSLVLDGPHELRDATPIEPEKVIESGYAPARASGAAHIAFPIEKQPADPPWAFSRGADARIEMRVRSGGGAGRGIVVELGGAAVASGLVTGVHARTEAGEAPMVRDGAVFRALLPDVALPIGVVWPLEPKPKGDAQTERASAVVRSTHFTVEVVVRGAAAGDAILSIAIGAMKSAATPLKRMRPVRVS